MGACRFCDKLRHSLQTVNVLNLFIFILLLSSANSAEPKRCQVDKCNEKFRNLADTDNVDEKCRLLTAHRNCLNKMVIQCRGTFLYHTSVTVNLKKIEELNCASRNVARKQNKTKTKNKCSFAGKSKYKFCSIFGDPHVRTFSDKFHTCKANGTWTLIQNDYVVVKATNSLLQGRTEATAISKLTVMIKDSGDCAQKKTYLAEARKSLPVTFTDGTSHSGLEKSVNLSKTEQDQGIQIDIRFIATTIVVRNVGTHLSFSIRMPEEIVNSPIDRRNHQMCVRGCPKRQRIRLNDEITRLNDTPKLVSKPKIRYSEHDARKRCREILLKESEQEEEINEEEDEKDEVINESRTKRSTPRSGGKTPRKSRNRRRQNNRQDLDPAATTWMQISQTIDEDFSRSYSRSKRNRKRHRHRRKYKNELMRDDPRPYSGKSGRRDRDEGNSISNIIRGKNFYFEACVFDLMMTGDLSYASSARGAFSDVTRFHKEGENAKGASKEIINSWTYTTTSTSRPQDSTTSPRPTKTTIRTTTTRQSYRLQPTTSGAKRAISHINIPLLLFCLISSLNLLQITHLWTVHTFFNNGRKT